MKDYKSNIIKTGFVLENQISQILRKKGWNIISNKYYEDDLIGTVREIDILAYKVREIDSIYIYTTLIISCKKNEENAWGLISRNLEINDPNSNLCPLHIWSNDSVLKYITSTENFNNEYYTQISDIKNIEVMKTPQFDIFAFQEFNLKSGKIQNDKQIFTSLTSLMKSQSYEIGALNYRKKNNCIYQFNLISIIDSELVRIHLEDENITDYNIETEQLVTRYIIKKKEESFRIRIIKANVFEKYLDSYNELHKQNVELFIKRKNDFYVDIYKNEFKLKLLSKEFADKIAKKLHESSNYKLNQEEIAKSIELIWDSYNSHLKIYVTDSETLCEIFNTNNANLINTKVALLDIYRYSGEFKFATDNLPF